MVTSIGGVRDLVSLIRGQLAPRMQKAAQAPARARAAQAQRQDDVLAGLIETRVRAIRRDDPQRGRKAFRVFLEALLLSELGEGLLADPRFFQLLDDVQAALEADEGSRALVEQAIGQLLATGAGDVV
ncbi:hypothetical protein SAMN05518865_12186 [Duganella sp. CF458]|uniref:hypothetical protein n=1 Tax=Duganella sp. CF458 TaxID=1884368 RepID=UPI0008EFF450|nr:hypothetical protein [Duganella sp. CF458]SFG88967.1 hypothetical protein SAMN05518865_12186 [Duganella sp. CF458]